MTGRELIKWILDHKAEDKKIEIQYRDSGGDYHGTDEILYLEEDFGTDSNGWQYDRIVL